MERKDQAYSRRAPDGQICLREIFGGRAQIEIEVGFGRGMFLVDRGREHPDTGLLGIETSYKWAHVVEQRCRRLHLDNVHILAGDAREILERTTPDGAVRRVFLHFPDPWWKKRHAKRRLMTRRFLDQVARLLEPAGEFFLQTDVEERAAEYARQVQAHEAFGFRTGDGFLSANPYCQISNRERRAKEDGLPVYRILAIAQK